jgi:hypothetical protein
MKRLFRYYLNTTPAEKFELLTRPVYAYFRRETWDDKATALVICGGASLFGWLFRRWLPVAEETAVAAQVAPRETITVCGFDCGKSPLPTPIVRHVGNKWVWANGVVKR